MAVFKTARTGKGVLLPSNCVLWALPFEVQEGAKESLVRPCVLFGGCHQLHLPPYLSATQPLSHSSGISMVAGAVVYVSLQCYKREFSEIVFYFFNLLFFSSSSGRRVSHFLSLLLCSSHLALPPSQIVICSLPLLSLPVLIWHQIFTAAFPHPLFISSL